MICPYVLILAFGALFLAWQIYTIWRHETQPLRDMEAAIAFLEDIKKRKRECNDV